MQALEERCISKDAKVKVGTNLCLMSNLNSFQGEEGEELCHGSECFCKAWDDAAGF